MARQLSDPSVHAQKAEDTVAAAQKETHDKIVSYWEHTRADATATHNSIARVAADFLLREESDEEEEDGEEHAGDEEDEDVDEVYWLLSGMQGL